MMRLILSTIFNLLFFIWTSIVAIICIPLLALPPKYVIYAGRLWAKGLMLAAQFILNIKYQVVGTKNLPNGGYIIASKHQSAFETIIFYLLCDMPAYVLKDELKYIPIFGWYISRIKAITVKRSSTITALKNLVKQACEGTENHRQVIIFPEGTRVKYGHKGQYKSGIAAIYAKTNAPIIPVALDSGKCWAKNSWTKQSGTITIKFMPAIAQNLNKKEFMRQLQDIIETGCEEIKCIPQKNKL